MVFRQQIINDYRSAVRCRFELLVVVPWYGTFFGIVPHAAYVGRPYIFRHRVELHVPQT